MLLRIFFKDLFEFQKDCFWFFFAFNSISLAKKYINIKQYVHYFFIKYIYTVNHKKIGINYFYFSLFASIFGTILAGLIRCELATPGSHIFLGDSLRYLQVITAHGIIMVFFVVVPIIFGGFANFLIPYHIGSKDVAYPRLNSIAFWLQPIALFAVLKTIILRQQFWTNETTPNNYFNFIKKNTNTTTEFLTTQNENKLTPVINFLNTVDFYWFFITTKTNTLLKKAYITKYSNRAAVTTGWTFITPFSSNLKYSSVGAQDVLLLGVVFVGISSTISFVNLLITKRTLCMPGIRSRRILLPFITINILLSLRMLALITPVLSAAMLMMLFDRHWGTSFFDFTYGGDPILSQHLFWFFGHPEVYVLVMPVFGVISTIVPVLAKRRFTTKQHMVWASYVMCYMGCLVWGHHMYLVGLDHRSRTLYSTLTIMISLPATIKVVNWTLAIVNCTVLNNVVLLFVFGFFFFFLVAGFTGMWLSHVGLNIFIHDTFYVVAHFHLMLSGTLFCGIFAGFYYYFFSIFNIRYSRVFAVLHCVYFIGGQWLTFLAQFFLGIAGMPRRIHDYPFIFLNWNVVSSFGFFISTISIVFFFFMLFDSHIMQICNYDKNIKIPTTNKRILYYLYKIQYYNTQNLNKVTTQQTIKYFMYI